MRHIRFTSAWRRCLVGAVLFLVAACATPGQDIDDYRDTGAPIGATTRFDLARFAGAWTVRAYFPAGDVLLGFDVQPARDGAFTWTETLVQSGDTPDIETIGTEGRMTGQGRFKLDRYPREFWVLWVDEGFRTAAIGTPDGRIGFIADRDRTGGADRIKAAREILDFNGYDVSRLRVIP